MNNYDALKRCLPSLEFLQNPVYLLSMSIASFAACAIMLSRSLRQRFVNILHHVEMHQRQVQIACLCWTFLLIMLASYLGCWLSSTSDVVTFTAENGTVYTADAGEYNKLYKGLAKSLEGKPLGEITVEVTSFTRLIDGKLKPVHLVEEKYIDDEGRVWTQGELHALPRE